MKETRWFAGSAVGVWAIVGMTVSIVEVGTIAGDGVFVGGAVDVD
jgi:hypothetical protein